MNKLRRIKMWIKHAFCGKPYSYNYVLESLNQSLEDLSRELLDWLFVPNTEKAFWEIMETITNIELMMSTDDEEQYRLAKHRVMYMLSNKLEEWYI